jgi:Polymerase beta, Nucleotidyltransferase
MPLNKISKTFDSKLEDVLLKLKNNPSVDAILITGSTANNTMHEHSDYDLACVLRNAPPKIMGITTFIDHKFSEIFFYSLEEVKQALENKIIDLNTKEGWIANWSRDGKIICDKLGLLARLKKQSQKIGNDVGESLVYRSWYRINYNLVQDTRYFESDRESYQTALKIKLLNSVLQVFLGYFEVRKIAWTGEKEAAEWLKENDSVFFDLFQKCLDAHGGEKFKLYKKLAELALEPVGGVWKANTEAVMPSTGVNEKSLESALDYWDDLIK